MSISLNGCARFLQIQEYMRQKAEREQAREREMAAQRMEKEKEIARLRSLQQRQQDLQVIQYPNSLSCPMVSIEEIYSILDI